MSPSEQKMGVADSPVPQEVGLPEQSIQQEVGVTTTDGNDSFVTFKTEVEDNPNTSTVVMDIPVAMETVAKTEHVSHSSPSIKGQSTNIVIFSKYSQLIQYFLHMYPLVDNMTIRFYSSVLSVFCELGINFFLLPESLFYFWSFLYSSAHL